MIRRIGKAVGRCARLCITCLTATPTATFAFKLALTEDWPTIKPYDEAAWARLADSRPARRRFAALIAALHGRWVALLESMSEEDFQKGYVHPEKAGRTWPRRWRFTTGTRATTPRTSPLCARGRAGRGLRMAGGDDAAASPELADSKSSRAYLADHPAAAVLEDGRVLFDMRTAHYAVSEQHGRCLLQLWSEERNLMRTVVEVQERAQCLRLTTRRMGAAKPQALELVPTSDRRTPTARDAAGRNYQRLLERVLTRRFIGSKVGRIAVGHGPGAQLWSGVCARPAAARDGGGRGDRRERSGVRRRWWMEF